ncbi:hypothetical protein G7054_g15079 [Neopestalotiopsis clavispora]|nr:hypothetical protein G7054_g15079 [Neopestalotiopsis clavispora]
MNHSITVPYSQGTQEVPLDQHGYPEQLKNGGLGKIKAKHIQGISSMVHDENMARQADYLEEAETGIQADVAGAVNITDDPTTGLSAGSDQISEGRRIYIGTPPCLLEGGVTNCVYGAEANCNVERYLKYTVTRSQVKHLLREFGVYNTVEKIYMPYAEGTQEDPFDQHDYLADRGYDGECYNDQEEPIELPNKGYVFVTYGDPAEAEAAINRLGGVFHLERKLVAEHNAGAMNACGWPGCGSYGAIRRDTHMLCRPGLPKGVAFRQDDLNGGASRWKRHRRWNRYDSILNEQQRSGQYFGANNALTHNGTYNAIYGNANAYNGVCAATTQYMMTRSSWPLPPGYFHGSCCWPYGGFNSNNGFGNGAYGCIRRKSTRHLFQHQKWLQLPGNELPNESYVFD